MPPTTLHLHPAESFILRLTSIAMAVDAALIVIRGSRVDIPAYAAIVGLAGALMVLGFFYRRSGRSEILGSTTTCAGLFILFTSALSLFNYCLLPNVHPTIDVQLAELDGAFGYYWPDAIAFASRHLVFNEMMRFAYLSTLPQIAILVIVLGLTRRLHDLHALMVTVTISGTITILFWGIFPTAGPSALSSIPDNLLAAVNPILGPSYGADVTALIRDGAPLLSPRDLRGLVAFPSFHTVLACAATYHARRIRWLFPFYLPLNILVLPAVLVHGAHHLVDIPAGIAVFLFAAYAGRRMFSRNADALPSVPVAQYRDR